MLNPALAKWCLLLAEVLRGEPLGRYVKELEGTQWLSRDRLDELQWARFKAVLAHAYETVPWYRRALHERCITPADIKGPADTVLLPVVTREDLRQRPAEFLSAHHGARTTVAKTSGSTGVALRFPKDHRSSGYGRAAMYRGHGWHGIDIGEKEAKLWGLPLPLMDRAKGRIGDFFLNRFRQRSYELTDAVLMDFYHQLERKQPRYLMAYPSMAYAFAVFMAERDLPRRFQLAIVKVTSEMMPEYQRRTIERVLGCPVVNEYGSAETGLIGFECERRGIHVMSECVLIEEDPAPSFDECHEFIITDLNNYTYPFIRYRLGDRGKLSPGRCECGRDLPLINTIQGRISDVAYKADGTPVHSSIFSYLLKEVEHAGGGVRQYKILQHVAGQLDMRIVKSAAYSARTESLLTKLVRQTFGADMKIAFEYVDRIPREPSGKLRYFESTLTRRAREASSVTDAKSS